METSCRDHFNFMAENRSISKIIQITHYPRLSFTPETGTELPKTGVSYFLKEWEAPSPEM